MKFNRRARSSSAVAMLVVFFCASASFAAAPIQAGIGLVWGNEDEARILGYDYVHFGQGAFIWREIEPREDEYDWSTLDATLARFHALGKKVPLQINTPCPEWVFDHVASLGTSRGGNAPQYWDPLYFKILGNFIRAYADHIASSPHRDSVLLVRMQYNALNTEILSLDSKYLHGTATADRTKWKLPANGHVYAPDLSQKIQTEMMIKITELYLEQFTPRGIPVALRMDGENDLSQPGRGVDGQAIFDRWMANPLAWTMTTHYGIGILASPESYRFKRRMRERGSIAFAEQFSRITPGKSSHTEEDLIRNMRQVNIPDAEGKVHLRELTPEQSYYWTMMMLLEWGFSYVSVYGVDHVWAHENPAEVAAMNFVNRYAGWSRDPGHAPGAWIVLGRFVNKRGAAEDANWGYFLKFENVETASTPVNFVGGKDSLEGVWARELTRAADFSIDPVLAASLRVDSTLRISWLNQSGLALVVSASGQTVGKLESDGSGQWRESRLTVPKKFLDGPKGARLTIDPVVGPTIVHLIELTRGLDPKGGQNREASLH